MTDPLILTLRVWDPKEKSDPNKSALWGTIKIDREDIGTITADAFTQKYIKPLLADIQDIVKLK